MTDNIGAYAQSMAGPTVNAWNQSAAPEPVRLRHGALLVAIVLVASAAMVAWGDSRPGLAGLIVGVPSVLLAGGWLADKGVRRHHRRAFEDFAAAGDQACALTRPVDELGLRREGSTR